MRPYKAVKLDFEARVPIPFSIFPSSYRDAEQKESITTTHEEVQIELPHHHRPGREGSQYSSHSAASADLPPRREHRYSEEEVRIVREREEDRYRRPGVRREEFYREELKEQQPRYCPIPICFCCSLSLSRSRSLTASASSPTSSPEANKGQAKCKDEE